MNATKIRAAVAPARGGARPEESPRREDEGKATMTPADFTTALEQELQRRGVPFDRGALPPFVERHWPELQGNPNPSRWASRFVMAQVDGAGMAKGR
jgi:hypothetical protein